jgi:ABC-type transporter Mla maintaining outer membrane lipid asymmetry ATPase subunit MlaF
MSQAVESHYRYHCTNPTDINEHLPVLREFAEKCEHVTEMGVRTVVSTWALFAAKPKVLRSYDREHSGNIHQVEALASEIGVDFKFILGDTRTVEIDPTDMLFIDTLHTYDQLKIELKLHAHKVKKYLAFHDTISFRTKDEPYPHSVAGEKAGLWPAIEEFLESHPEWKILLEKRNNNGLTILERTA